MKYWIGIVASGYTIFYDKDGLHFRATRKSYRSWREALFELSKL